MPRIHVKTRITVEAADVAVACELVAKHLHEVARLHRDGVVVDGVNVTDPSWPEGMCYVTTLKEDSA